MFQGVKFLYTAILFIVKIYKKVKSKTLRTFALFSINRIIDFKSLTQYRFILPIENFRQTQKRLQDGRPMHIFFSFGLGGH